MAFLKEILSSIFCSDTRLLFRMGTHLEMCVEDTLTWYSHPSPHNVAHPSLLHWKGKMGWAFWFSSCAADIQFHPLRDFFGKMIRFSQSAHKCHDTRVMTHNAELCIMAEKLRSLFIFLVSSVACDTFKMLTTWVIERKTASLYVWTQYACSFTDKLPCFRYTNQSFIRSAVLLTRAEFLRTNIAFINYSAEAKACRSNTKVREILPGLSNFTTPLHLQVWNKMP